MRKMCLLIGTGSQVSDVAHGPLVLTFEFFFFQNLIAILNQT